MRNYRYRGYLIDLDGTLFRGKEVIPEGLQFIEKLEERGLSYLYLTNNSSRRPEQVAEKLRGFGYPAHPEQVVTSSAATARTLVESFGRPPSVYPIGEEGLVCALEGAGCRIVTDRPDAVVVGIDRTFSYDKMKTAVLAIRAGARYFGTNGDLVLPTEEGLLPGSGSLCTAVAVASGVKPTLIGKPEKPIVDMALKRLGLPPEETVIVGDNLATDIQAGVNTGIDTLLVFTGVTTPKEHAGADISATYTLDSLKDWDFI
ncbi:TIGR01457 family HAD-type hydrolase [Salinithrix halophila]|uniref:Acid sugar phosphatase n=1 Tax=Salinithrix halophila TaxID=1485204 RepID=A0ABV8JB33_9BACL